MRRADRVVSTHYVCVAVDHAELTDLTHGHYTVKSGTWGYCANAVPQDAHEWRAVTDLLHGSPQELGNRIAALRRESVVVRPRATASRFRET